MRERTLYLFALSKNLEGSIGRAEGEQRESVGLRREEGLKGYQFFGTYRLCFGAANLSSEESKSIKTHKATRSRLRPRRISVAGDQSCISSS